jgi:hypothetical protein
MQQGAIPGLANAIHPASRITTWSTTTATAIRRTDTRSFFVLSLKSTPSAQQHQPGKILSPILRRQPTILKDRTH